MSMWAHGSVAGELLQEHRRRAGAAGAAARIDHVGDLAANLIEVLVVERHRPAAVARALRDVAHGVAPRVRPSEQARTRPSRGRRRTRPSASRHRRGASRRAAARTTSPSPRIRRPSASVLITSTVLPLAPVSTSPGFIARPPGMFSVVGTTPTTRIGAFSSAIARMAQTTAAPPAMSSFIRSMPSAGLIEIPPVSNVIPLPTRPRTGRLRRARRIVAQDDDPRRLAAAARHAEQQPHAEPLDLLLVEHLDADAGVPRDRRGALREDPRRQHVGRLVGEAAREVAGLAEDAAALDRALERARLSPHPAAARRPSAPSPAGRTARPVLY